jgi:hypothetical protein
MLNGWDIEFMKESVHEVITAWNTTLTVLTPLPIDQQPNYNKLMCEYTGDIEYTKLIIPAERKDIVNNQTNDIKQDEVEYGEKNAGVMLYAIPDMIPTYDTNNVKTGMRAYKPAKDDIFIVDATDDRYYIRSMRDRMGETLVTLHRYVGGTPNGNGTTEE